jgi:hypothetical protein
MICSLWFHCRICMNRGCHEFGPPCISSLCNDKWTRCHPRDCCNSVIDVVHCIRVAAEQGALRTYTFCPHCVVLLIYKRFQIILCWNWLTCRVMRD